MTRLERTPSSSPRRPRSKLSPVDELEQRLLFRCVSEHRWRKLRLDDFSRLYVDEVGDASDIALSTHSFDSSTYGTCCVHLLENGLAVLEAPLGRFSLFETEARCKARDHINAWAEFCRGRWALEVPQEPGLYFVKPLDGHKQAVRELKRVDGRLKDVTRGEPLPRVGLVSEWRGYWWFPRVPSLP